jgi:hypothetical protein
VPTLNSKFDFIESQSNNDISQLIPTQTAVVSKQANTRRDDYSLYDKIKSLNIKIVPKDPLIPRSRDLQNVDQLYQSFTDLSKKRLIIFQNQKTKYRALFYVRSEFDVFYHNQLCEQIFENTDLIPEFPSSTSFLGLSMVTATVDFIKEKQYDEIFFILEHEEIYRWQKTQIYDNRIKNPILPTQETN